MVTGQGDALEQNYESEDTYNGNIIDRTLSEQLDMYALRWFDNGHYIGPPYKI